MLKSKKRIDEVETRYSLDSKNRIIQETKVNGVHFVQVITIPEVHRIIELHTQQIIEGANCEN